MNRAFSLVELSIVLVILGLLTGGILAGQSLIRAAETRSIVTEFQRYNTAIYTFRDKYFALPGDFTKAYDFWGISVGCTNTVSNNVDAGCNGNGDGQITENGGGTAGERYRAWQHLAQAGIIEGNYTGTQAVEPSEGLSRLSGGRWHMRHHYANVHGWVNQTGIQAGNQLKLGGTTGTRLLDATEAWNLDTKIDDGRAGIGKMFMHGSKTPSCFTATMIGGIPDAPSAVYSLDQQERVCQFIAVFD